MRAGPELREQLGHVLGVRLDRVRRGLVRTGRLVLAAQVDGDDLIAGARQRREHRQEVLLAAGVAGHQQRGADDLDVCGWVADERRQCAGRGADGFTSYLGIEPDAGRNAHRGRVTVSSHVARWVNLPLRLLPGGLTSAQTRSRHTRLNHDKDRTSMPLTCKRGDHP